MYASIATRITGAALSVLLYGFSIAYLVAPGTFNNQHIVDVVASLPESVKYARKTILAAPFAFHSINGLRHLSWDLTKFLTVKSANSTSVIIIAVSAMSTIALVLMK